MKKLLMFVVCALLALPACAGAEASPTPAVEPARALGDGYAITYDPTEFSFYLDGVIEGTDLLVPTQDAVSPVYLMVSRIEDVQAEIDSFTGETYADAGEVALPSGLSARTFTLTRSGVDYACYIIEGENRAYSLLTVCSQEAAGYAELLRAVVDTFTLVDDVEEAAAANAA